MMDGGMEGGEVRKAGGDGRRGRGRRRKMHGWVETV
jgi:hypothetical protein